MHRQLVPSGLLAAALLTLAVLAAPPSPATPVPRSLRTHAAQAMPYFSFAGVLRQRNG